VIRTLALAALVVTSASPALAYQTQQIAVSPSTQSRFSHFGIVAHMVQDTASETYRMRDTPPDARGGTVVYDVTKGKGADRVDVNGSHDNPFMARPEREPKPAQ
jgi:hypothetical protein